MISKALVFLLSFVLLCACVFASCTVDANPSSVDVDVYLEPTSELVLYNPYYYDPMNWINSVIEQYKKKYPTVKVTVELFRINPYDPDLILVEQYERRMATELLAGEGPDVVFLDPQYFDNIEKMAASGYFADLNPLFEADPDFDADEYYQPVFDVGLSGGQRAFVPYRFQVYSYISSEERLRAVGADPARITDCVSLLEEAETALPVASQNPDFIGLFAPQFLYQGVSDNSVYERIFSLVGSALARRGAGEAWLDSGALRAFLIMLKPCYQFAQSRQQATGNPSQNLPLSLSVHQMLNGKVLFVACGFSGGQLYNWNAVQDGVANFLGDESLSETEEWKAMFSYQTPVETPVAVPYTNLDGEIQAVVSEALAINIASKNKANAYNFIKMLLNYREENTYYGYDLISKELNAQNAAGYNDVEKLNPEEDLLAYQVEDVVFENPVAVDMLKECMLPFLNDERSYESCETRLFEWLRMYWGETA